MNTTPFGDPAAACKMGDTDDFSALVAQLREDPEAALKIDLPDEDLLRLQKELDPYARIAGPARDEENIRVAALSYTNITQDYATRFAVTSTVGFLWRMLSEWKIDAEERRWKTAKAQSDQEPFTLEDLEVRAAALTNLVSILKEKRAAFDAACDTVKAESEKLILSEEEMQQVRALEAGEKPNAKNSGPAKIQEMQGHFKAARNAEDEYTGMLYTTTLELRNMGVEADQRLLKSEAAAKQFPKGRAAIQGAPNRYRGILPGQQQEVPEKLAKGFITSFLSNFFEFNPDAHVRKAYDEAVIVAERRDVAGLPDQVLVDPHDPDRLPLAVLLEKAPPETTVAEDRPHLEAMIASPTYSTKQRNYNVLCHLLRDEKLAEAARYILGGDDNHRERWRRMLLPTLAPDVLSTVPPQDTFHRLQFYMDANFEALRAATESIYHEKPYLDFALSLMDYTSGTPTEVKEWGERFRDQNQDNVISEIKLVEFGAWTFLGEFERNRQIANIFNRQTDILKRILDRHEEDKKLGGLLMRQRVKSKKAENIRKEGPDAPGLATYKEANPVPGAREALSVVERKRLEKSRGSLKAARELEYYEQYEQKIRDLESRAKLGELSAEDKATLKDAYTELERAKDMLEVPDDAIQVDVWQTAPDGKMVKTKMFTKAADAGGGEDETLAEANISAARAVTKSAPHEFYPEGSRELAKKAFEEGKTTPAMAPFAQDFFEKEIKREADEAEAAEQAEGQTALEGQLTSRVDALLDEAAGGGKAGAGQ